MSHQVRRGMALVTGAALVIAMGSFSAARAEKGGGKATLKNVGGATVGIVEFAERNGAVEVEVKAVSGLPSGFHGFHVHAVGVCDPATGFVSAGGHFNPALAGHPGHAGDMPVLLVKADGTGGAVFQTDRFNVADVIGKAVIVHALPDNYANIPTRYAPTGPDATTLGTGDAGGRLACGVVKED